MGKTESQLKKIKKGFKKDYFFVEPFNKYINGCGISNISVQKGKLGIELDLKKGETLEDLCLYVTLKKKALGSLGLPAEYKGVRVFYEVMGEIKAL